jgi:hypothetical protein
VEKYHARVSTQLENDRRKLQVMMPFGEQWEGLNKRLNASAVCSTTIFNINILALGPTKGNHRSAETTP